MKKILLSILILTLPLLAAAQDRYAPLDSLLAEFYTNLEKEAIETKEAEMDDLIESCRDSLTRQHVALAIFDHYRDSHLMGEEEVAIHIYDRWFADDTVPMTGEFEKLNAQMFADFNRNTLIGMDAPVITLRKPCGGSMAMPEQGCTAIIYFHDPSCSKCKLTDKLLPQVLDKVDFKCRLYSVFYGDDAKAFRKYRRDFKIRNRNIKTIHLWDPGMESEFQRLYGVLSTPKIYMATPDGMIIGRRLELESLQELLPYASAIQSAYDKYK